MKTQMKLTLLFALICGSAMAQPVPSILEAQGYKLVLDEEFGPNWYSHVSTSGWINTAAGQRWLPDMPNGKNNTQGWFGTSVWNYENMNNRGAQADPLVGCLNAWYYTQDSIWIGTLISSMDWSRNGFTVTAPFYLEASVKLPALLGNDAPNTTGLFPAPIWLEGANCVPGANYGSRIAEIDIEAVSKDFTSPFFSLHDWDLNGNDDVQYQAFYPSGEIDFSKGSHIYGILVTSATVTWYIDGIVVASHATPPSALLPMFILSDVALGGGWPVNLNTANTGVGSGQYQMQIDYIRAFKQ